MDCTTHMEEMDFGSDTFQIIHIIKTTRCTNFSNLFLE